MSPCDANAAMNFASSLFLLYFLPVFLGIYFLSGKVWRTRVLLIAGSVFFFWGAPTFFFILIASVLADYFLSDIMAQATGKPRKRLLVLLITLSVATLFYYKYTNFFISNINFFTSLIKLPAIPALDLLLPLGISFITFQRISYFVDVYRGTTAPATKLRDYALFILFFPRILAGPLVKYADFSAQLSNQAAKADIEERLRGFFRFAVGLVKKVMIANVLAVYADEVFSTEVHLLSTPVAWLGALAFTFQLYFDFSGYTDMAIGLARMIGYKIPENFNNPYISTSVTEFWKRWHITLGQWLRDYLFLPVAYAFSRRWPNERYAGLKTDHWIYISAALTTMIICGLWHGAGWTFVIWGAYHGLLLALDRLFLLKLLKPAGRVPSILITFTIIVVGWVFLRSESIAYATSFISLMFGFVTRPTDFIIDQQLIVTLIFATMFAFFGFRKAIEKWQMHLFTSVNSNTGLILITVSGIILFVMGISHVTAQGFNPFIYFRF